MQAFGFEQITVADEAIGLTSSEIKPSGQAPAQAAFITVEDAPIRFRTDGSDPTSSVGHKLEISDALTIYGLQELVNFRAIRIGSSSGTLMVSYQR